MADRGWRSGKLSCSIDAASELCHRPDGASFAFEYSVRPIVRDDVKQGAVCGFVDISERQRAEANIRTFYNHSSECHAVLVAVENGHYRYEEINPATLSLYGKTRDQVIGYTVDEVFGAEKAAEVNKYLSACLQSGAPYRYERMQGDQIVEAIASPVPPEPGKPRRLVVTARVVTETRRLEQQLRQAQKMEAVGQLTGGIAHDFNNLLTVILGNVDSLRRRYERGGPPSHAEFDRLSAATLRAAQRAASLTHRLLAFSRQQPLAPQPIDINKLISGMSDMLRRTLGEAIAVEVVGTAGLWWVNADPNQLESAILNLAINARDAMPGGGKLTVETGNAHIDEAYASQHEELTPGQYVLLAVSDTGTGMSPETVSRAFEPFFTTKRVGEGSGLGLSMIYGFVKQSGGHVKIYSEPGHGTAVKIYLPRYDNRAVKEPVPTPAPHPPAHARREEVVLVVEDNDLVRDYSIGVFEELGFATLEAHDAESALNILDQQPRIDLLFTDIGLPGGVNGRVLADEARRRRPDIKVLFTTGYTRNAIVHNGTLDSGVELVTKPFTIDLLARKVREMLPSR